jgi:hypothetical protein
MSRSLSVIAAEIRRDWKRVNFAAVPYLQALWRPLSVTSHLGARHEALPRDHQ